MLWAVRKKIKIIKSHNNKLFHGLSALLIYCFLYHTLQIWILRTPSIINEYINFIYNLSLAGIVGIVVYFFTSYTDRQKDIYNVVDLISDELTIIEHILNEPIFMNIGIYYPSSEEQLSSYRNKIDEAYKDKSVEKEAVHALKNISEIINNIEKHISTSHPLYTSYVKLKEINRCIGDWNFNDSFYTSILLQRLGIFSREVSKLERKDVGM